MMENIMAKHARVLNECEFNAFVNHISAKRNGARNRLVAYLTHYAGMRIGEIAGLKLNDLMGPAYGKTNANVYVGNVGYVVHPQIQLRKRAVKAKHARSVHLSKLVQAEIITYCRTLDIVELNRNLCMGYKGPMSNVTLAQQWRNWVMEVGLYGASSHSGRRGYVTKLLDNGVNIRTVQELVGHRFLSTTQLYADVIPARLVEAVETL
jgi:integrase/recombinase XerD